MVYLQDKMMMMIGAEMLIFEKKKEVIFMIYFIMNGDFGFYMISVHIDLVLVVDGFKRLTAII